MAQKLRARVTVDRIDVTSVGDLIRGQNTYVNGVWRVSLSDGRSRKFAEWRAAIDYAVRVTSEWDPFA